MEFNNLKKFLANVGDKIVKDARDNLSAGDHHYTGRLSKSVKASVVETGGRISLRIRGLKYGMALDQGFSGYLTKRDSDFTIKASKAKQSYIKGNTLYTPWQDIQRWVKAKGIGGKKWKSAAYLINRSLKMYGSKPTYWLQRAKNKNIKSKSYRQGLKEAVMMDIKQHYRNLKYTR